MMHSMNQHPSGNFVSPRFAIRASFMGYMYQRNAPSASALISKTMLYEAHAWQTRVVSKIRSSMRAIPSNLVK